MRAVIAAQRDIMTSGPDLERVMQVTTERALALTSAAAAVLELREGNEMVYRAGAGSAVNALGLRLDVHHSLSGRSVLERRILRCDDTELDARVDLAAARKVGARSMLCVPLLHDDEAVGVLKVYSPEVAWFEEEDVSTLELMVGFISAATSNALAQQRLRDSEQRFRMLAELASDGIITVDREGVIRFLNRSAARMFDFEEQALLGAPFMQLLPERYFTDAQGRPVSWDAARSAHAAGRTLEFTARRKNGQEFPVELSTSSWLAGEERFFTAIVRDVSERKRLEQAVLALARRDHLTGLCNRAAGEEAIALELERAVRYGRNLSFVLLDIDHFKHVNDSAGHAGGDEVLRRLGELILTRMRATDVAIRWGGEELMIVLPEVPLEGAQDFAESLRSRVEQTDFEVVPHVSISAGVATRHAGERADQTIARADERLYAAKNAGRNRVEI